MSFSPYMITAIRYIEAHVRDKKIDYRELEKRMGFSEAYIRELFCRNTGCSLSRYVRNRKIQSSALELIHTDASILDIALRYGFSSHESYTRAFRKATGMTPSRFRRERPVVGKEELASGVYGIGFPAKKERRSDVDMNKRKYTDNDSTILYGVPKVGWGVYGGDTPYPICLKACLDYLGEDVGYPYVMVSGGAAFRLTWNEKNWDLSNVDIFHTRNESSSIYAFGAEALGRDFEFLGRDKGTRKEEFIHFIRRHIDNGYPCIAQGIIGPPEACVVTGYKDGGKTLLGWNFFQEDTEFAGQVEHDESGYFMCDSYWENTDTQGIMCLGPISGEMFTHDKIMRHAVEIMKGRKDSGYAKGIAAYDAWEKMIGDDAQFGQGDNDSMLMQKILCHNDAMVSLIDGRGCAAAYFSDLAKQTGEKEFSELAAAFGKTKDIVCRMREVIGGWDDLGNRLSDSSDTCLRKKICGLIRQAKEADEKSLQLMIQKLKF